MNANDSKKLLSKDFLSKNNSPQELLKRLEVEQEGENELEHVAKSLLQDHIFKNKDDAVRLTAACCLADVIRVYAPNSPFNDEQTKKIFKLFIQQLGGLEHVESPLANKIAYLLERLAVVKAFVLVADFEDVKLKLFNQMFSVIREDHPKMVVIHVLDTLMSVIDESDTVSQELLEVVLKHLVSEEENHESPRLLAWHLIYRCAEKLKPYLTEYINNLLEAKSTENELREQSHKLIFELNLINPELISEVIPHLEEELTVDNLDVRSEVVQLLANMFSTKDSSLATNYRTLYVTFLQRFKDINSSIREVMITDFAKPFILNITDTKLIEQVQNELKLKLLDPIEKVRIAAVTVTCECAELVPEAITHSLLQELEKRLRDKKVEVRSVALNLLANLYQSLCTKFGLHSEWKSSLHKLYSWIPNKIFHSFFLPSVEDKCRADEVIQNKLLPQEAKSGETARFLIDIVSCLDLHGTQALSYYIREKKIFRDEFRAYLELRKAKGKDADEEKLNQKMSFLTAKLPTLGDGFKKLVHSIEDTKLFDSLSVIVNLSANEKDISNAKKYIEKSYFKAKKDSKKKDYLGHILRKLTFGDLDSRQIKTFMKQIKAFLNDEEELSLKSALLKFVEDLSYTFPNFFGESTSQISEFISSDDELALDSALQIIANVPQLFSDINFAKSMKDSLNKVCLEGTATQTRKAIQAISKAYSQKDSRVSLGKLAKSLCDQAKEKKVRPACFDGLDELCVVSPSSFCGVAGDVVDLILKDVLPKQPKANQNDVTTTEPSDECAAKMSAMRLVTTYLLGSEDEDLASEYMKLLFSILDANGATLLDKKGREDKDKTSKSDRSFVRTIATCSLLRLAENRNYEKQITVENFQNLARQTEDEFHEVRKEILSQLFLGLKEVQRLPLRYIALLVLYATDPEKELVSQAKKDLQQVINLRRLVLKQTSEIDSNALTALLPENSLPYVVHLLAHSSYFPKDAPNYFNTHKPILVKEDNYPFLIELLQFIKQTEDVQEPKSNNIHVISDLSLLILQQKMDTRKAFTRKHTGTVYLPPKLFRQPEGNQIDTKSYLPLGFQLAKKTNKFDTLIEQEEEPEKAPKAAKNSPTKKRKAAEEAESSEEMNEDFDDIIKSPAKKAKVAPGKKKQKGDSEEESSPKKSPVVSKKATKKTAQKPGTAAKKPKGGIEKPTTMRKTKEAAASPKKQTKAAKETPKSTPTKVTKTPSPKKATATKTAPAKKVATKAAVKPTAAKTTPVKKTVAKASPKGKKQPTPTNSQKGLKQTTLTKSGAVKK